MKMGEGLSLIIYWKSKHRASFNERSRSQYRHLDGIMNGNERQMEVTLSHVEHQVTERWKAPL
jgi:hypothetical protein